MLDLVFCLIRANKHACFIKHHEHTHAHTHTMTLTFTHMLRVKYANFIYLFAAFNVKMPFACADDARIYSISAVRDGIRINGPVNIWMYKMWLEWNGSPHVYDGFADPSVSVTINANEL